MANFVTLGDSADLALDDLAVGVLNDFVCTDELANILPFRPVDGNAYKYVRVLTPPNPGYLAVNGLIPLDQGQVVPITTDLATLTWQARVDTFIQKTRSKINDQMASRIQMGITEMWQTFGNTLINGTGAADSFVGLQSLVAANQIVDCHHNCLTIDLLDAAIDCVSPRPTVLLMSSRAKRTYKSLLRDAHLDGQYIMLQNYGQQVLTHDGIPIVVSNFIGSDCAYPSGSCFSGDCGAPASGSCTTSTDIYALYLSPEDGVTGLTSTESPLLQIEDEAKSETRLQIYRNMYMIVGLAIHRERSAARLRCCVY